MNEQRVIAALVRTEAAATKERALEMLRDVDEGLAIAEELEQDPPPSLASLRERGIRLFRRTG